jgi:hypothetical protein
MGVIGVSNDSSTGFWVTHTIPKYPGLGPYRGYPAENAEFGNDMMCMSLTRAGLAALTTPILLMRPRVRLNWR